MSERRQLQSLIFSAADRLRDAASQMEEARDYMDSYEFLQEANPGLRDGLGIDAKSLRRRADELWDLRVLS